MDENKISQSADSQKSVVSPKQDTQNKQSNKKDSDNKSSQTNDQQTENQQSIKSSNIRNLSDKPEDSKISINNEILNPFNQDNKKQYNFKEELFGIKKKKIHPISYNTTYVDKIQQLSDSFDKSLTTASSSFSSNLSTSISDILQGIEDIGNALITGYYHGRRMKDWGYATASGSYGMDLPNFGKNKKFHKPKVKTKGKSFRERIKSFFRHDKTPKDVKISAKSSFWSKLNPFSHNKSSGINIAKSLTKSGAEKFGTISKLGRGAIKGAGAVGTAMLLADIGEAIESGDKEAIAEAIGGGLGSLLGSLVGARAGFVGSLAGSVAGGIIGDKLGEYVGELWENNKNNLIDKVLSDIGIDTNAGKDTSKDDKSEKEQNKENNEDKENTKLDKQNNDINKINEARVQVHDINKDTTSPLDNKENTPNISISHVDRKVKDNENQRKNKARLNKKEIKKSPSTIDIIKHDVNKTKTSVFKTVSNVTSLAKTEIDEIKDKSKAIIPMAAVALPAIASIFTPTEAHAATLSTNIDRTLPSKTSLFKEVAPVAAIASATALPKVNISNISSKFKLSTPKSIKVSKGNEIQPNGKIPVTSVTSSNITSNIPPDVVTSPTIDTQIPIITDISDIKTTSASIETKTHDTFNNQEGYKTQLTTPVNPFINKNKTKAFSTSDIDKTVQYKDSQIAIIVNDPQIGFESRWDDFINAKVKNVKIFGAIWNIIKEVVGQTGTWTQQTWNEIKQVTSGLWQLVKKEGESILDKIGGFGSQVWDRARSIGQDIMTGPDPYSHDYTSPVTSSSYGKGTWYQMDMGSARGALGRGETRADLNALVNNFGNVKINVGGQLYFGAYATPKDGLMAIADRILHYDSSMNAHSVSQIIHIYAPSDDGNNPASYSAAVAQNIGVSPFQAVNWHDPKNVAYAIQAIAKMENSISLNYNACLDAATSLLQGQKFNVIGTAPDHQGHYILFDNAIADNKINSIESEDSSLRDITSDEKSFRRLAWTGQSPLKTFWSKSPQLQPSETLPIQQQPSNIPSTQIAEQSQSIPNQNQFNQNSVNQNPINQNQQVQSSQIPLQDNSKPVQFTGIPTPQDIEKSAKLGFQQNNKEQQEQTAKINKINLDGQKKQDAKLEIEDKSNAKKAKAMVQALPNVSSQTSIPDSNKSETTSLSDPQQVNSQIARNLKEALNVNTPNKYSPTPIKDIETPKEQNQNLTPENDPNNPVYTQNKNQIIHQQMAQTQQPNIVDNTSSQIDQPSSPVLQASQPKQPRKGSIFNPITSQDKKNNNINSGPVPSNTIVINNSDNSDDASSNYHSVAVNLHDPEIVKHHGTTANHYDDPEVTRHKVSALQPIG